jgi:ERCC4-type nuclease
MTTLNEALEKLMELDYESREMIIEIAQKRQVEERRKEIAQNAKKEVASYKKNKAKAVNALEVISQLNNIF